MEPCYINTNQYIQIQASTYQAMMHTYQYKSIQTTVHRKNSSLMASYRQRKEEDQALVSVEDLSKVRPLDPFWDVGIDGLLGQRAGLAV